MAFEFLRNYNCLDYFRTLRLENDASACVCARKRIRGKNNSKE